MIDAGVSVMCPVADAFTGMGVVLKDLKRLPEAEACFEAVVRLRANCALAHGNLAGVCLCCVPLLLLRPLRKECLLSPSFNNSTLAGADNGVAFAYLRI